MAVTRANAASQYEFGHYRVDFNERSLTRDGEPVHLPPKTFDLLLVLLSNAGHLVQKAELRQRVWPDTFVDDVNMAQHVSILRKALHDGENGCRYIETMPRLGYRFAATVCHTTGRNGATGAGTALSSVVAQPQTASAAAKPTNAARPPTYPASSSRAPRHRADRVRPSAPTARSP